MPQREVSRMIGRSKLGRWRSGITVLAAVSLLLTTTTAGALAGDAEDPSSAADLGKLDKPFGSLGLGARADAGGFVDARGLPYVGPVGGLVGADIDTYAVERVDLNKKQAKQARQAHAKAKETFGLADNIKPGENLVAVVRTAGPADGDVTFFIELNGPKANDRVPGFALDPRNGNQLVLLAGEFAGALGAGDTLVTDQALTDALQFYNTDSQTAGWRKGDTWYILRPLPKGATVANLRSQIVVDDQQLFDVAGDAPSLLGSVPGVPGVHCFSAAAFPGASFDGAPAATNTLQLSFEGDPTSLGSLDLSSLHLIDVTNGAAPIDGSPVIAEDLGWASVTFGGVPNGRFRLAAGSAAAEPIALLFPGAVHLDGQAAGSLLNGLGCASLVEPLLRAGVDPCSFGDVDAIAELLAMDPSQIVPTPILNPDASPGCVWSLEGAPGPFAGLTLGVRLEESLEPIKLSLGECEIVVTQGELDRFVADCPGNILQLVAKNEITGLDTGGLGLPSGFTLLGGGSSPRVDELLEELRSAVDGDPEDVEDILQALWVAFDGPFGFEEATEAEQALIRKAQDVVEEAFKDDDD